MNKKGGLIMTIQDLFPTYDSAEGVLFSTTVPPIGFSTYEDFYYYFILNYGKFNLLTTDIPTITKSCNLVEQTAGKQAKRMVVALESEYNPIENYNMLETTTNSGYTDSTSNSGTDSTSATNSITNTTGRTETNVINKVNPWDTTTSSETNSTNTIDNERVDTNTATNSSSTTYGLKVDNIHGEQVITLTRSGNIGVTTTQQMLESEIKLRTISVIDWYMNQLLQAISDLTIDL